MGTLRHISQEFGSQQGKAFYNQFERALSNLSYAASLAIFKFRLAAPPTTYLGMDNDNADRDCSDDGSDRDWVSLELVCKGAQAQANCCTQLDDSTGGRAQAILDDVILHAEAMIRREMIRQRSDLLAGDDEYVTFSVSIDLGRQEIQWQSEEQHAALDGDDVAAAIEATLWQLQVFVD